jgi:AraC-like DNA-binding protein
VRSAVKRLEIWQAIERYATNPTRTVSRDLLSRETGVPERTLDHICHAFTGLSPIAYIKRRHMSLAHAMLQRAAPDATVTSIATFCGFSDLGRFAVRYHHRYGQPPSQTLRQPAQPIVAPLARTGAILHVPEGAPSPDGNIQEPPLPLYWLSVEDLICRNRALLAEAAAAARFSVRSLRWLRASGGRASASVVALWPCVVNWMCCDWLHHPSTCGRGNDAAGAPASQCDGTKRGPRASGAKF